MAQLRFFLMFVFGTLVVTSGLWAQTYCDPEYVHGTVADNFINSVRLGAIQNDNTGASSAPFFEDFTNLSTDLDLGGSYSLEVQVGTYVGADHNVAAWIDYNQDGDFDDVGEKIGEVVKLAPNAFGMLPFTVPASASAGATRMRVRTVHFFDKLNPCQLYLFGEAEDYSVSIQSNPTILNGDILPDADEGVLYQETLQAGFGTGPYTWTGLGLPQWLSLDQSSGVLSGTPPAGTAHTTYLFDAVAEDSNSVTANQTMVLYVDGPPQSLPYSDDFELTLGGYQQTVGAEARSGIHANAASTGGAGLRLDAQPGNKAWSVTKGVANDPNQWPGDPDYEGVIERTFDASGLSEVQVAFDYRIQAPEHTTSFEEAWFSNLIFEWSDDGGQNWELAFEKAATAGNDIGIYRETSNNFTRTEFLLNNINSSQGTLKVRFRWLVQYAEEDTDSSFVAIDNLDIEAYQAPVFPSFAPLETELLTGAQEKVFSPNAIETIGLPFDDLAEKERFQALYLASDLSAAGLDAGSQILSMKLKIPQGPITDNENFRIRIQHTNETQMPATFTSLGWVDVYGPETIKSASVLSGQWITFDFSQPFVWDGTRGIFVDFSTNGKVWSSNGNQSGGVYLRKAQKRGRKGYGYEQKDPEAYPFDDMGGQESQNYVPSLRLDYVPNTVRIITDQQLSSGDVGISYLETLAASYGQAPYAWSITTPSQWPAWLNLDAQQGTLTGTPPASASGTTLNIEVSVSDGLGKSHTKTFELEILSAPQALPFFDDFETNLNAYTQGLGPLARAQLSSKAAASGSSQGLQLDGQPGDSNWTVTQSIADDPSQWPGDPNYQTSLEWRAAGVGVTSFNVAFDLKITSSSIPSSYPWHANFIFEWSDDNGQSWQVAAGSGANAQGIYRDTQGQFIQEQFQVSGVQASSGILRFRLRWLVKWAREDSFPTWVALDNLEVSTFYAITTQSPFVPEAYIGVPWGPLSLTAAGGSPAYTWSKQNANDPVWNWLNLTSAGELSGTPPAGTTLGLWDVPISVIDQNNQSLSKTLQLKLNQTPTPLQITTGSLPAGEEGVLYKNSSNQDVTLNASGGVAPYTWSIFSGSLPPGLSFGTSAGGITGTPQSQSAGSYSLVFQVSDQLGTTEQKNMTLNINAQSLSITTALLADARESVLYSATLGALGGVQPYSWSLVSGTLPSGLSLSTQGTIVGTPAAGTQGNHTFRIRLDDSQAGFVEQDYTLFVGQASTGNQPLAISSTSLPNGKEELAYSLGLKATGGQPVPYFWALAAGQLPSGLSFDSSGIFSGSPIKGSAGNYSFTLSVSDGLDTITRQFSLTIESLSSGSGSLPSLPTLGGGGSGGGCSLSAVGENNHALAFLLALAFLFFALKFSFLAKQENQNP